MKKVGIIGASGFIGSYNTKKFLEEGYKVKASTTDLSREEKYEHLESLPKAENLKIVELDVANKDELKSFLEECNIVIHGGTPFQLDVKDPKAELLDPTIEGTKNFLEIVQNLPGIEKVVFIASVAAYNTNFPLLPSNIGPDESITENNTPFRSDDSHPYAQAKFIANRTVEKFIDEHPNLNFEITSVSPVGVMGKAMSRREDSTSMGLQFLFKNRIAPNPSIQMFYDNNIYFAIVDVEDIADAVYKAATIKGTHGKNYLLSSESYRVSDISLMLNDREPKGKAKIVYRCDLAKKELGINFKPAKMPLNKFSA